MGNKKVKIFNNLINLIPDQYKLQNSTPIAKGEVLDDWIDYNDHMNMAFYVQCFEESSDFLLEHLGLGYDYAINQDMGVFVVKCDINYKKEIKLREKFIISLESIIIKGKKLILKLIMTNNQNDIFADYEIVNLNVDLKTKKSVAFDGKIINKLA
tara:strand:+ start:803 stop:1267 length:465 start_codon:yes stop_codon:yes gene_type:complete